MNHAAAQPDVKPEGNIRIPTCRFCKSRDVVHRGTRQTLWRGKIKRYGCKTCARTFTMDDGFFRMRNAPDKITRGIDLYFSNLSSRKVRNHYKRHDSHKISHVTVLDWCRKYTLKVHQYIDTLEPKIGGRCFADDTQIDRAGHKDHFWACIDWDTRYISAIHYSVDSGANEATAFLRKAKKAAPRYIQTDAAMFYPKAFRKAFYVQKTHGLSVEHRVNNHALTGRHNVKIESLFMKIKDRVYDFRGLKALWSAPILMAGIALQHNFVEEHTSTRKLPAELAGVNTVTNENRWLGLIRRAASA